MKMVLCNVLSMVHVVVLLICVLCACPSEAQEQESGVPTIYRDSDGVHVTALAQNESVFIETNGGGKFYVNGRDVLSEMDAWKKEIMQLLRPPSPDWASGVSESKLNASDISRSAQFGASVSVSGNTVVVGASRSEDDTGSAYVYVLSGGKWMEQAKLTASDGAEFDYFGSSVAISGDTIVVGAYLSSHSGRVRAGSAYVFVRSGSTWTEEAKLIATDAASNDHFGESLSIDEDIIVVGASGTDASGLVNFGSAYVYERSGTTWVEQPRLTAGDAAASDNFGVSVSVAGETIVVGADGKEEFGVGSAGAVFVFVRSNEGVWTEQTKLTAQNAATNHRFGTSVSIAADTILVGALETDNSGTAYVFVRSNDNVWNEQAELTSDEIVGSDNFGTSVSVTGDTAVVGAYGKDAFGAAYVFVRTGNAWTEQVKLTASDGAEFDRFGISVTANGNTIVAGAYWRDQADLSNSGAAYAFTV